MSRSKELLDRASSIIPGGVNSPVRAYSAVGNIPPFIDHAEGSYIYDVDGNKYIDYVGSWGPMIAGHANPRVLTRIRETMKKGTSFGAPTELEIEMAEKVIEMVPSVEMVRMVNSGTEATLSAIRVARGFTGRDMIIKFDGCYHGHGDSLLVSAGSGVETLGLPDSPGVPVGIAELTKSLPYNDLETLENVLAKEGEKIACIILEPVIGNMGLILPEDGFLAGVRSLCDKHGVLLIFDEVMTGFRLAKGGAQELFGIRPDMTTLGKIIGGGLPVGAYGGRKDIMSKVAPAGPIYQAGTLSGNPLAMSAGLAMLEILCEPGVYEKLETSTSRLLDGLLAVAESAGLKVCGSHVGSMFGLYFTHLEKVRNYVEAKTADTERFGRWHAGMLAEGIYLAPSQFEAGFMSLAHSDEDISATISSAEKVLRQL